ncbi:MAG: hypothetical protein KIT25_08330 [Enhydrobacter sp.]|nr:MAG: hypothetical protein KIT25_08330 [Enhydrobacter sp.]
MKAAGVSIFAAILVAGAGLPAFEAAAQGQVQAVPRAGVAFSNVRTTQATVEHADVATRTIVFTTIGGRLLHLAVADGVRNLADIADGSTVDVTFTESVTILNLRQKGPGSREARREGADPSPTDIEAGRFTLTVVGVDLPNNRVSVISGQGGAVRTLAATSVAQKDMIGKIKVGDVVIGLTTPLTVTAISPVK